MLVSHFDLRVDFVCGLFASWFRFFCYADNLTTCLVPILLFIFIAGEVNWSMDSPDTTRWSVPLGSVSLIVCDFCWRPGPTRTPSRMCVKFERDVWSLLDYAWIAVASIVCETLLRRWSIVLLSILSHLLESRPSFCQLLYIGFIVFDFFDLGSDCSIIIVFWKLRHIFNFLIRRWTFK